MAPLSGAPCLDRHEALTGCGRDRVSRSAAASGGGSWDEEAGEAAEARTRRSFSSEAVDEPGVCGRKNHSEVPD